MAPNAEQLVPARQNWFFALRLGSFVSFVRGGSLFVFKAFPLVRPFRPWARPGTKPVVFLRGNTFVV